jgi:hypothetical protein
VITEASVLLDRQSSQLAQRLDGLHAASAVRTHDPSRCERRQERGEQLRLGLPGRFERSQLVGSVPVRAVAGPRVPDQDEDRLERPGTHRRVQDLAVVPVSQSLARLGGQ